MTVHEAAALDLPDLNLLIKTSQLNKKFFVTIPC